MSVIPSCVGGIDAILEAIRVGNKKKSLDLLWKRLVDDFEGPVETLPPAKPKLRAEDLPIGTVMHFGTKARRYTLNRGWGSGGTYQIAVMEFYEDSPGESGMVLTLDEVQELIDRGVEFRLPEGGEK